MDNAASPSAPNSENNDDGSTHHNSDASSKDSPVKPQAKVNPKLLYPIKEDKIKRVESKLKEMEVATKSLPAMSSALETSKIVLPLCRPPPTYQPRIWILNQGKTYRIRLMKKALIR